MAKVRPGIRRKIINVYYDIPVQYRRPFMYIGKNCYVILDRVNSMDFLIGYIVSLLVGLGNGDVGNIIHDVRSHARTRTNA